MSLGEAQTPSTRRLPAASAKCRVALSASIHLISKTALGSLLGILASARATPNKLTCLGLILVIANCALYYFHRSTFWFGAGLSVSFAFDLVDGAFARRYGLASKFGGYLDAVVDRYQEIAVFAVLALVNDWWIVAYFAATGSLLTSYNKARIALEAAIDNKGWRDFLNRGHRVSFLCLALLLDEYLRLPDFAGGRLAYVAVLLLAVLTHVAAVRRFLRGRHLLTTVRMTSMRP